MAITKIQGSSQIKFTGNLSLLDSNDGTTKHKITNLADPSGTYDAVNVNYLNSALGTLSVKTPVRVATNTALPAVTYSNGTSGVNATLTGTSPGAIPSQDGVSMTAGNRILVKDQTAQLQNGIYSVTTVGDGSNAFVLTRTTDCDESVTEVKAGIFTFINEGTSYADTGWLMTTNDPITVGSSSLVWEQAAGSDLITAGDGLIQNGDAFDVNVDSTGGLEIVADALRIKDNYISGKAVIRETPSGSINGTNTVFTLANTPIASTECVYLNGMLQEPGAGNDYTISSGTITYLSAPVSGDKLRVNYFK